MDIQDLVALQIKKKFMWFSICLTPKFNKTVATVDFLLINQKRYDKTFKIYIFVFSLLHYGMGMNCKTKYHKLSTIIHIPGSINPIITSRGYRQDRLGRSILIQLFLFLDKQFMHIDPESFRALNLSRLENFRAL